MFQVYCHYLLSDPRGWVSVVRFQYYRGGRPCSRLHGHCVDLMDLVPGSTRTPRAEPLPRHLPGYAVVSVNIFRFDYDTSPLVYYYAACDIHIYTLSFSYLVDRFDLPDLRRVYRKRL